MSNVPGVIPSAAAGVPYHSAKSTRLEYSTVAKTVFCTFVMSNVPGVIPSAAAGVHLIPTKRTRLEYSTVAKTGYIDPATKNDYNFNFPKQNSQKNDKISKNTTLSLFSKLLFF
ncbi:hypothetical protein BB561_006409 [Smittium simulii]|uniref:Uncharacterized protein n=1 Tax=Smittium simulii TaxID=133385 RepID=A0A2T9Y4J5_9FUNG|nr:hypothetical protein BB561_006409 [Smittium simulii]